MPEITEREHRGDLTDVNGKPVGFKKTLPYGLDGSGNPNVPKVDSDGNLYTIGTPADGSKIIITDGTDDADVLTNADDDSTPEDLNGLVTSSVLYARSSSSDIRPLRCDSSTNSLQTIDYSHHEIHGGSHYFVVGFQDLAVNEVLDFTWVMPDTTKWIHWVWSIDCEDEIEWYVYENVTINNALANTITPYNSNRNSANTSGTTMKYEIQTNLAAANTDTDVTSPAILLKSGLTKAGSKFQAGGGGASRDNEIILKQNTTYCLRAIANAASFINFDMEWYEHTDKS